MMRGTGDRVAMTVCSQVDRVPEHTIPLVPAVTCTTMICVRPKRVDNTVHSSTAVYQYSCSTERCDAPSSHVLGRNWEGGLTTLPRLEKVKWVRCGRYSACWWASFRTSSSTAASVSTLGCPLPSPVPLSEHYAVLVDHTSMPNELYGK